MQRMSKKQVALGALSLLPLLWVSSCGGGGGGDNTPSPAPQACPATSIVVYPTLPSPASSSQVCPSITYAAPSGATNNIVFTFDKPYRCDQFANGDWWVSADSGGSVTITAITPTSDAVNGRNGFEVNPSSTTKEAFDKKAYDSSTAALKLYDATLLPTLPLVITPATTDYHSVVKAASVASYNSDIQRPTLQFAAVLTVVKQPIDNSTSYLRPAYFGPLANKKLYATNTLNLGALPKCPAAATLASAGTYTLANVAQRFRGVQLDHVKDFRGRSIHPLDNMTETGYGAEIARDNAVGLVRMLLDDFSPSNSVHVGALMGYLQMAVDLRGMALGGTLWPANGGHANGRKLPLVFAASLMTSDAADFTTAMATAGLKFSEDDMVYYNASGTALYGKPPVGATADAKDADYWKTTYTSNNGANVADRQGARDLRDPYGYIDGGGYEIGDAYQTCCTAMPWRYNVLALRILNLKSAWNYDALFDYVDRFASVGVIASPDPCAPFATGDTTGALRGVSYGLVSGTTSTCITGAGGRWMARHGAPTGAIGYTSSFGDAMWTWYQTH